jgi:putative ABC transport system permease protein
MGDRYDLRDALRALRRQPAFSIAAIVTFALALGTTTAIFAALHAVILTPLPFAEPSRLIIAWRQEPTKARAVVEVSHHQFREWQKLARSFEQLAAMWSVIEQPTWTMSSGERRKIAAAPVSHEFFSVLGAAPILGRGFLPEEDRINAADTVVLAENFWRREFAGDPAIIGRTLILNDRPCTIVGVMPRRFAFPFGAELWTPVSPAVGAMYIDNPSWGVLFVVGRLRPDVSPLQAKQELDQLIRQQARGLPGADTLAGVVTPLVEHVLGNTQPILLALGGTGVIVLAIACANIVGLLLVRAMARRRESAVRSALGASRWRIARLWLTESLLLAGAGLIGGLLLASWGTRALVALAPESTPQLDRITLTWPVVIFAIIVCLSSAIVCGLVPAWLSSRVEPWASLQAGARDSEPRSRRRARHALVVAQLGLAMVLLVGAGLMIRSVLALRALDLGFRPERVLAIDVSAHAEVVASDPNEPMPGGLDERQRKWLAHVRQREAEARPYRLVFDGILARVRALPQVQSAGGTYQLPLIHGPIGADASVLIEGQAPRDWMKNPFVNQMAVTVGYFEAMGTRLVAGRLFTVRDTINTEPVVIIGETAARRFFPGRDAVGRQLSVAGAPKDAKGSSRWQTIVGVVADGRLRGIDDVRLDVYMPHQQTTQGINAIVVRTTADPAAIAASARAAILAENPRAVIGRVQTLETIVGTATAPWRFGMRLFLVLAGVAFALALTGLFGVIAYSVAQRHREMAIRLALGALPGQVRGLVMREGAALIAAGLAIGSAGTLAATQALSKVLYGVSPFDAPTIAGVVMFIALCALTGCYLATRRIARIDAVSLLR